ncbi:uncharacterized protein VTP21DRAFT_8767 [Calcarisporiella thermophila]|uniref:uncharacterized protein n=1 Tax=Calcarisporiella thermophila TaxID=911321 RepID=UPI003743E651
MRPLPRHSVVAISELPSLTNQAPHPTPSYLRANIGIQAGSSWILAMSFSIMVSIRRLDLKQIFFLFFFGGTLAIQVWVATVSTRNACMVKKWESQGAPSAHEYELKRTAFLNRLFRLPKEVEGENTPNVRKRSSGPGKGGSISAFKIRTIALFNKRIVRLCQSAFSVAYLQNGIRDSHHSLEQLR